MRWPLHTAVRWRRSAAKLPKPSVPSVPYLRNNPAPVIWFVWSVSFVWLNQTNQSNQTNKMNQRNQAIGQNHFALVDVFVGPVPFIACQAAGPDVVFKVKGGEKQPLFGQFHICVRRQVVVDIGRIVFELRLVASLRGIMKSCET